MRMRKLRVVLDTNVVVSAHLNAEGYERHVLDLVLAGKLQIAVSAAILEEYEGVLRRPKFGIAAEAGWPSVAPASDGGAYGPSSSPAGGGARSGRKPVSGVRRSVQGRLPGDGKQTPFSQAVAAGPSGECPRVDRVGDSGVEAVAASPWHRASYAVSTAKSISMATVTMSKSTCSVFGRMPLRSGRKACVPAYMVR